MRIRTQFLIFLLPVFILAGGLIGALKWIADTQMLEWGGEKQISTMAVSIANILDTQYNPDERGFENRIAASDLDGVLNRIDALGASVELAVFDSEQKDVIFRSSDFDLSAYRRVAEKKVPERLEILNFTAGTGSPDYLKALCTLKGGRFVIFVRTDGSWIQSEASGSLREAAVGLIVSVVTGVFISLGLSFLITRSIRRMRATALAAVNGNYNASVKPGLITEFSDLSNTFRTMTSLMNDILQRIRRTLIEQEQFRNSATMLEAFHSDVFPLREFTEPVRLCIGIAGNDTARFFYSVESGEDRIKVVIGEVIPNEEEPVPVTVSAIEYMIRLAIRSDLKTQTNSRLERVALSLKDSLKFLRSFEFEKGSRKFLQIDYKSGKSESEESAGGLQVFGIPDPGGLEILQSIASYEESSDMVYTMKKLSSWLNQDVSGVLMLVKLHSGEDEK